MPHVRKPKLIDERLALHADYLAQDPAGLKGQWRTLLPGCRNLRVDLGCGKGQWTVAAARLRPDELVVGIDCEPMCISFAAEHAAVGGVASSGRAKRPEDGYVAPRNVVFAIGDAAVLPGFFAPGEIVHLHMNFPTPFPRKKETQRRVVGVERLAAYRPLLGAEGMLHLKTDSQPLFDYATEQLVAAGYDIVASTRDLRSDASGFDDVDLVVSEYEQKLVVRGAKLHALRAVVREGAAPNVSCEPKSLYDYLPSDLDAIDYVPLGMENALVNMRNRKRNGH